MCEDDSSNAGGEPTALAQVMANILESSKDLQKKKIGQKILTKTTVNEKSEREKNSVVVKREARHKRQLAKLSWEKMGLVKPNVAEKDKERNLVKIATRGVVQLFNAVAAQQDRITSRIAASGTTDVKRTRIVDSLSRSSFIDLLKSQSGREQQQQPSSKKQKLKREAKAETQQPKWKTLHDDFVMSEYASGIGDKVVDDSSNEVKAEPD